MRNKDNYQEVTIKILVHKDSLARFEEHGRSCLDNKGFFMMNSCPDHGITVIILDDLDKEFGGISCVAKVVNPMFEFLTNATINKLMEQVTQETEKYFRDDKDNTIKDYFDAANKQDIKH